MGEQTATSQWNNTASVPGVPLMEVFLLGRFGLRLNGQEIWSHAFRLRKARDVIKLLALAPNHQLHKEQVMEMLWPEADPDHTANNLHQALYTARQALRCTQERAGPFLVLEGDVLWLSAEATPVWVDVKAFEQAVKVAHQQGTVQSYERAISLYSGDLLPEDNYEAWAQNHRSRLRKAYLELLYRLGNLCEAQQAFDQAQAAFSRLVQEDALNEEASTGLMRVYARMGQHGQAVRLYHDLVDGLKDELDLAPGPETQQVYQQILAGEINPPAVEDYKKATARFLENLPQLLPHFVGREDEIQALTHLLNSPEERLVTVLGLGGMGKTRLAIETARQMKMQFTDGICLVAVSELQLDASLLPTIAEAVGLKLPFLPESPAGLPVPKSHDQHDILLYLADYLKDRRMLLILDSFERVIGGATHISQLLEGTRQLKIMVTSRVRLNLLCEQVFPLDGMDYPDQGAPLSPGSAYSAVQLFIEAAQRVRPAFIFDQHSCQAIYEICRLNQGMPLGILLAAGWMETMEPEQIATELRQSQDLLEGVFHDAPERMHSLRATFEYSWRLLSAHLRQAFAKVAVFQSSFNAQRAMDICGVKRIELRELVDHSLLLCPVPDQYRLHDLLRQYAQEKLNEDHALSDELNNRHAQVYLAWLGDLETSLKSKLHYAALEEVDAVYADLLAGWNWAVENEKWALLKRSEWAWGQYHKVRVRADEGQAVFYRAALKLKTIGLTTGNLGLWLRLSIWQAKCLLDLQAVEKVEQIIQEMERLLAGRSIGADELGYERAMLIYLKLTCGYASQPQRPPDKQSCLLALKLLEKEADDWSVSLAYYELGKCMGYLGDVRQEQQYILKALRLQKKIGDPSLILSCLNLLGMTYMYMGQPELGMACVLEQQAYYQNYNDRLSHLGYLQWLGLAEMYLGKFEQSEAHFRQSMDLVTGYCDDRYYDSALLFICVNAVMLGRYAQQRDEEPWLKLKAGSNNGPACLMRILVYTGLKDDELAEEWILKYLERVLSNQQMELAAIARAYLGYQMYQKGEIASAVQCWIKALEEGQRLEYFVSIMSTCNILALALAEQGCLEEAAEVYGLARSNPYFCSRYNDDLSGFRTRELLACLPEDTRQQAERRGRESDLFEQAGVYAHKLRHGLLSPLRRGV
jgi:DNA-binding SARP family transcriptional activator/predicted ATPase